MKTYLQKFSQTVKHTLACYGMSHATHTRRNSNRVTGLRIIVVACLLLSQQVNNG